MTTPPPPTTTPTPPAAPSTLRDLPTGPLHTITRNAGPRSRLACRALSEAYGCPGTTLDLTLALVDIAALRLTTDPPPTPTPPQHAPPAHTPTPASDGIAALSLMTDTPPVPADSPSHVPPDSPSHVQPPAGIPPPNLGHPSSSAAPADTIASPPAHHFPDPGPPGTYQPNEGTSAASTSLPVAPHTPQLPMPRSPPTATTPIPISPSARTPRSMRQYSRPLPGFRHPLLGPPPTHPDLAPLPPAVATSPIPTATLTPTPTQATASTSASAMVARLLLTWRWRSTLQSLHLPPSLDLDPATCHVIATALPSLRRLACASPPWTPLPPPPCPTLTALTIYPKPHTPLALPVTPPALRALHLFFPRGAQPHARCFEAALAPLAPSRTLTHLTLETNNPFFWDSSEDARPDLLAGLRSQSGSLASLRISDARGLGPALIDAAASLPLLQELTLDRFSVHALRDNALPALDSLPTTLTRLQLTDGSMSDAGLLPGNDLEALARCFHGGSLTLASLTLPLALCGAPAAPAHAALHGVLRQLPGLTHLKAACIEGRPRPVLADAEEAAPGPGPSWLPGAAHLPLLRSLVVEMRAADVACLAALPGLTSLNLTLEVGAGSAGEEADAVRALGQVSGLRRLVLGLRHDEGPYAAEDLVVACLGSVLGLPLLAELNLRQLGKVVLEPQVRALLGPDVRRRVQVLAAPSLAAAWSRLDS